MAVDYGRLSENLRRFYDFTGKVVLFVGAAGGQLLDPGSAIKKLIAIDRNADALREVVGGKFEDVTLPGDVVYFEFCLHEMANPEKALSHAKTLARDIVVFDHLPDSDWVFYAAEDDKVRRSAEALRRFGMRRSEAFLTEQRFKNFDELLAKMAAQGAVAIQRAQRFAGATDILIPMSYELALL